MFWKWTEYEYRIPLFGPYYSNIRIVWIIRTNTDTGTAATAGQLTGTPAAGNHHLATQPGLNYAAQVIIRQCFFMESNPMIFRGAILDLFILLKHSTTFHQSSQQGFSTQVANRIMFLWHFIILIYLGFVIPTPERQNNYWSRWHSFLKRTIFFKCLIFSSSVDSKITCDLSPEKRQLDLNQWKVLKLYKIRPFVRLATSILWILTSL